MAPSYRTSVVSDNNESADLELQTDSLPQIGDFLVLIHMNDFYTINHLLEPTDVEGSWNLVRNVDLGTNFGHMKVWTREVISADIQTVTLHQGDGSGGDTDACQYGWLAVLDGTDIAVEDSAGGGSTTAQSSMVAPSVVATSSDYLLLCAWIAAGGSTDFSSFPSGMAFESEIDCSTFSSSILGSQTLLDSAGATGTRTISASPSRNYASVSIVLAETITDQDLEIPFHQQITSIFTPTIENQLALNLTPSRLESSVQLFSPTIENQSSLTLSPARLESGVQLFTPTLTRGDQFLHPARVESTLQFFVPTVHLQSSLELDVGFLTSSVQLFVPMIENQANLNLNVPFRTFTATLFNPTVFNEGDELFEPTLVGNGSLADQIMAGLIDQGFLTGTLADREYNRLLSKLTLSVGDNFSLADLYRLANEDNRIAGLEVPA